MASYIKATNFFAKDALISGDPDKLIKGSEIDTEFNSISTAVNSKADITSPTFTGTPLAPTALAGTNSEQIATTEFVQNIAGSLGTMSTQNANAVAITGGTVAATFTGNLTGNVTGNATGSSGSCTGNSATATYAPLISGTAQATTSGTNIDFTGIPSWVKRITVMFNGVSTNGSSILQVQLGDSGGIEITGYLGSAAVCNLGFSPNMVANSTGFLTSATGAAGFTRSGIMTICNLSTNIWTSFFNFGDQVNNYIFWGGGSKSLSATLDRVRITTVNGTDTFDAGSINIMYE